MDRYYKTKIANTWHKMFIAAVAIVTFVYLHTSVLVVWWQACSILWNSEVLLWKLPGLWTRWFLLKTAFRIEFLVLEMLQASRLLCSTILSKIGKGKTACACWWCWNVYTFLPINSCADLVEKLTNLMALDKGAVEKAKLWVEKRSLLPLVPGSRSNVVYRKGVVSLEGGYGNSQNSRYWVAENTHVSHTRLLHSDDIGVCCPKECSNDF